MKKTKWSIIGVILSIIMVTPIVTIPIYLSRENNYTFCHNLEGIHFSNKDEIAEKFNRIGVSKNVTKIYINSISEIEKSKNKCNANLVSAIIFVQDNVYQKSITNNVPNTVILKNIGEIKEILKNDIISFKRFIVLNNIKSPFITSKIDYCLDKLSRWSTLVGLEKYKLVNDYLSTFDESYEVENEINLVNDFICQGEIDKRNQKILQNGDLISTKQKEIASGDAEVSALVKIQKIIYENFGPSNYVSQNLSKKNKNVEKVYNTIIVWLSAIVANDVLGTTALALLGSFFGAIAGLIMSATYALLGVTFQEEANSKMKYLETVMINNIEDSESRKLNVENKYNALHELQNFESTKNINSNFIEECSNRFSGLKTLIYGELDKMISGTVIEILGDQFDTIMAAVNLVIDSQNLADFVGAKKTIVDPFLENNSKILSPSMKEINNRIEEIDANSTKLLKQIDSLISENGKLNEEINQIKNERQIQELSIQGFENTIESDSVRSLKSIHLNYEQSYKYNNMTLDELYTYKEKLISETYHLKEKRDKAIREFQIKYDNSDKAYWQNLFDNIYENNISNIDEYNQK